MIETKTLSELAGVIFLLFALGFAISQYNPPIQHTEPPVEIQVVVQRSYEEKVFDDVQAWRIENDLPIYIIDEELCPTVLKRLDEIKIDWSHNGFYSKTKAFDYRYEIMGENLSRLFIDPHNVLPAWLNSKTHRDNLERNYTHTCIKCTDDRCVHWFGKEL